jgi:hypothetical protein
MPTKTAQQIASQVTDPASSTWEKRRLGRTPPGKAQQIVLDALGIEANNFAHANEIFTALGISVVPVRQGRRSVPSVRLLDTSGGAFNLEGEGEAWDNYAAVDVDLSVLDEWLEE